MVSSNGVTVWGGSYNNMSNNCSNNKPPNQLLTHKPMKVIIVTLLCDNLGYIKLVFYTSMLIIFLLHLLVVYFQISSLSMVYIMQMLINTCYILLLYTI